jgi:hypothetical protein
LARGTFVGQSWQPARQAKDLIVTLIVASRPNIYTGSPLDRAGERRTDEAWISAALADPETLWAPLWRSRNLMRGVEEGQPEAVFLTGEAAMALRAGDGRGSPWAFLGLLRETPVFAVDLSAAEDPTSAPSPTCAPSPARCRAPRPPFWRRRAACSIGAAGIASAACAAVPACRTAPAT